MQTQSLLELTEQMIEAALEAESRYQEGKETGRSYDFFDIIKPDVETQLLNCSSSLPSKTRTQLRIYYMSK